MNRNDFIRMMQDTDLVDRQMIGEIRELLDLFPYFQSAHMLLLKGLYDTGDIKFENQLKQSAIYLADREVLYYLLKNKPESVTYISKAIPEPLPEKINTPDSLQTVIETGKSSEELIKEIEKDSDEIKTGKLDEISEKGIPGHSILISTESDSTESPNMIVLIDEEAEPAEETIFYMDPAFYFPEPAELLELDLQEKNQTSSTEEPMPQVQIDREDKSSRKQLQADLIDKFIIANPKIEPVREKSDHISVDISKPFVEERGGFITETLAKIYVSQGYYSKAIDIYEKLNLKYPEKSSYFATQIEKVKGLIK